MQRIVRSLVLVIIGSGIGVVIAHFSVTFLLMRQADLKVQRAEQPRAVEVPNSAALSLNTKTSKREVTKTYGARDSRAQILAVQESWIQVVSTAGDVLFTRVLHPGDIYGVPERRDLLLRAGNAGGLSLVVDGNERSRLGELGQVLSGLALSNVLPPDIPASAPPLPVTPTFAGSAEDRRALLSADSRCETWNAAPSADRDWFIRNGVAGLNSILKRDTGVLVPYLRGCLDKLFARPCATRAMSVPEGSAYCIQVAASK